MTRTKKAVDSAPIGDPGPVTYAVGQCEDNILLESVLATQFVFENSDCLVEVTLSGQDSVSSVDAAAEALLDVLASTAATRRLAVLRKFLEVFAQRVRESALQPPPLVAASVVDVALPAIN